MKHRSLFVRRWLLTCLTLAPALMLAQLPQTKRYFPHTLSTLDGSNSLAPQGVAISPSFIALGYPLATVRGQTHAGGVLILNAATGAFVRTISAKTPQPQTYLGSRCAISGKVLVVGAPFENNDFGAVYCFDITTGKELMKFSFGGPGLPELFGYSVAVQGDHVLVGAPDRSDVPSVHGRAYLFRISDGALVNQFSGGANAEVGDNFGFSVCLNNRQASVGAPGATSNAFAEAGAVYVFDALAGTRQTRLVASNVAAAMEYGYAVTSTDSHIVASSFDTSLHVIDGHSLSEVRRIDRPSGLVFFGRRIVCVGMTAFVNDAFEPKIARFDLTNGQRLADWPVLSEAAGVMATDGRRVVATGTDNATPIYTLTPAEGIAPLASVIPIKPFAPGLPSASSLKLAEAGTNAIGEVFAAANYRTAGVSTASMWTEWFGGPMLPMLGAAVSINDLNAANPALIATSLSQFRVGGDTAIFYIGKARTNGPVTAPYKSAASFVGIFEDLLGSNYLRRSGDLAAGTGQGRIADFLDMAVSNDVESDVAARVRLTIGLDGITTSKDSAVIVMKSDPFVQQTTLASAREGAPEPDNVLVPPFVPLGEISPSVAFSPNRACFVAFRQTGNTTNNQAAYSMARTGAAVRFVTKGDSSAFGVIGTILGMTADSSDQSIVRVTLTGGSVNTTNNELIGTEANLFVQKGAQYPGADAGVVWNRFLGVHPARGSGLIVHGSLRGPKVTAATDGVVCFLSPIGASVPLLREGDVLPGSDGARVGSILKVDARPGDAAGSYLILATLAGAPADSNLAIFSGRSAISNDMILTPRLPYMRLKKGAVLRRANGYPSKLASIQLPGRNIPTSGLGGGGRLHWQANDGKAALQLDWSRTESDLVRLSW